MNVFTKKAATDLSAEFQAALETVCKKHGLTLEMGNGRFSTTEFSKKFTVKTGSAPSREDIFSRDLGFYHPKLVGQKIEFSGKLYNIVGYDKKKRKNDILIEDQSGKRYCTYSGDVYSRLGMDGSFWGK